MFCTNCGKKLEDESLRCKSCGSKSVIDSATLNQKQDKPIIISSGVSLQDILDNERDSVLEKNQILALQQKRFRPINTGIFFVMMLAMMVPILNIILLFIWAFRKNTNVNRKSFARANLSLIVIFSIAFLITSLTLFFMDYPVSVSFWLDEFKSCINSINL